MSATTIIVLLFAFGVLWVAIPPLVTYLRYREELARTDRVMRVRRKVVVNLKTGRTFTGVLWEQGGDYVVLRNAEMLEGRERVPVDGEVVLDVAEIEFTQVPA